MSVSTHLHWSYSGSGRTAQLLLARVRLWPKHIMGACRLSNHRAYVWFYVNGQIGYRFDCADPWERLPLGREAALTEVEHRFKAHLAAEALTGHGLEFIASAYEPCPRCPSIVGSHIKKTWGRDGRIQGYGGALKL